MDAFPRPGRVPLHRFGGSEPCDVARLRPGAPGVRRRFPHGKARTIDGLFVGVAHSGQRVFPETRYAKKDGVHIAYQVVGEGDLDLLLVSAWFSYLEARWEIPGFAHYLRRLSSFSRVISFDKHGIGLSDPIPLDRLPPLEEWMDDVRAVLDAIGCHRAAVMGANEGSLMAALFAASYPERVTALVIANPMARPAWAPDHPWGFAVGNVDVVIDEVEEFLTGTRHHLAGDRVLSTILFTDIVESTARAVELGDSRWRELLEAHEVIAEREVASFGGIVADFAGDGLLASFDGPARAVRCAFALRHDLRKLGLEMRAGLHTGEVERRGDRVAGTGVHIASRIISLAGPGEVLASRTVRDLVAGSGLQFIDRGTHALKGIPDEWQVLDAREAAAVSA